jgi:hypothetical protein
MTCDSTAMADAAEKRKTKNPRLKVMKISSLKNCPPF